MVGWLLPISETEVSFLLTIFNITEKRGSGHIKSNFKKLTEKPFITNQHPVMPARPIIRKLSRNYSTVGKSRSKIPTTKVTKSKAEPVTQSLKIPEGVNPEFLKPFWAMDTPETETYAAVQVDYELPLPYGKQ